MDNEKRWWFSLKTRSVEDDDGPTPGKDRLGPFATKEEAARALATVQKRNEEWDSKGLKGPATLLGLGRERRTAGRGRGPDGGNPA
ncbi:MAG: hypothetical protein ACRDPY_17005 [Streptosporangiaceae bacterium]